MKYRCLVLFIFILVFVKGLAQDSPEKNASKVSNFKAKLAKTELTSKSSVNVKKDDDDDDLDDILVPGVTVPPQYANETIKRDHHVYYNSTFYSNPDDGKQFWINLDVLPEEHVITHEELSDSYRQATTVELSFDFPFYGSLLRNVTIATGGFLYMGDYLHNWIAATQYVAPLMANFDTRVSKDSVIKYADNGTAFTVQWENVAIQGRTSDGYFTFQATLLKNGDILFAYKDIPYSISSISDSQHPVKVGLSDAYILERAVLFIRRKTVYEYNRIHVTNLDISNNTALYFTALPTCNTFKDCKTCLAADQKLECNWCEAIQRCSDGIDRQRQSWVENGCTSIVNAECPAGEITTSTGKSTFDISTYKSKEISSNKPLTSKTAYNVDSTTNANEVLENNEAAAHLINEEESSGTGMNMNAGVIATIVLIVLSLVTLVSIWIYYAYKNPQSSSGQFLIKYRPSQWAMKKDSTITSSNSRHF